MLLLIVALGLMMLTACMPHQSEGPVESQPVSSTVPSASRDCDGFADQVCEAAGTAALSAIFPAPGQHVVAWHVRPTTTKVCDGVVKPKFDVVFELEDPVAVITVTVGELPDGRLSACSY